MLIDSHCHLPTLKHNEQLAQKLFEAQSEGVAKLINVGTSIKTSQTALDVAKNYASVFSTISVYPHEDLDMEPKDLVNQLKGLSSNKKVVAVGETGLDISEWHGGRSVEDQLVLYEEHIKLALDLDLPLILHNRNADDLIISTLKRYKTTNLRGVAHCFSSTWETAQQLLDLNFMLSFAGMITYPSRKSLLSIIEKVPMDMFLVETDSPYLPPQGHRGEENQPKYVKIVAEKIAQVKQKSLEDIALSSTSNACRLFNL
jgi:TatD DNase family protein